MSTALICRCGKPAQFGSRCEDCFADDCGHVTDIYKEDPKPKNMSKKDILELPIAELELSIRTANILSRENIHFIKYLLQLNREDLMDIRGFGKSALDEIEDGLSIFNLSLKQ